MEGEGFVGWEMIKERGLWGDAGVEVWGESSLAGGGMNLPCMTLRRADSTAPVTKDLMS